MINGKKMVITGASSGIGKELCALAAGGNRIVAAARRSEKIPEHPNITPLCSDISGPEAVDQLLKEAFRILGDVDIFIANAGFAWNEVIEDADWEHIASIFKTNVFSPIYSLEKLREYKGERPFQFMITASAMSFAAMPGYALYSGTKFALKGITDGLRYELPPGQLIQMVYPVATITSFFDVAGSKELPWPRQSALTVAKAMLRGIEKRKKQIFPSRLYRAMHIINRVIPIIPIYMKREAKKLGALRERTQ
jgi:uncharacterized protein